MPLNADRISRDNLATEDQLISQMNTLESQVLAWMGTATALHASVEVSDQAQVIALRQQLIDKLTAALAV